MKRSSWWSLSKRRRKLRLGKHREPTSSCVGGWKVPTSTFGSDIVGVAMLSTQQQVLRRKSRQIMITEGRDQTQRWFLKIMEHPWIFVILDRKYVVFFPDPLLYNEQNLRVQATLLPSNSMHFVWPCCPCRSKCWRLKVEKCVYVCLLLHCSSIDITPIQKRGLETSSNQYRLRTYLPVPLMV